MNVEIGSDYGKLVVMGGDSSDAVSTHEMSENSDNQ